MIQRGDIRWFRFSAPDKRIASFPERRWSEVTTALLEVLGLQV